MGAITDKWRMRACQNTLGIYPAVLISAPWLVLAIGRDPEKVALAYTPDSQWRHGVDFIEDRAEIIAFLAGK